MKKYLVYIFLLCYSLTSIHHVFSYINVSHNSDSVQIHDCCVYETDNNISNETGIECCEEYFEIKGAIINKEKCISKPFKDIQLKYVNKSGDYILKKDYGPPTMYTNFKQYAFSDLVGVILILS